MQNENMDFLDAQKLEDEGKMLENADHPDVELIRDYSRQLNGEIVDHNVRLHLGDDNQ